jgi:hypothetical protein
MENQPTQLDNVVKISIIAGALMVALSLAYYLVIFLPKKEETRIAQQQHEKLVDEQKALEQKEKEQAKELQVKTAKCLEDAKRYHQEYIKSISGYYMEPKYNFNKTTGRCLYSGGYRVNNNLTGYWERVVIDVYTNETILTAFNGFSNDNIKAFWVKHNELMNN